MKRLLIFSLVLVLVGLSSSAVLAQEPTVIPPCADGEISGTIVAYDEDTGIVTLNVEGELCTVDISSDYDHPIVELLGAYFSDINPEEISEALDNLQVCVITDGETTTTAAPQEDGTCAEGELVTVTGQDEEGNFQGTNENGDPIDFSVDDEETAGVLSGALDSLQADLTVEDGGVQDVGDDIAQYHDDGIGFGVLVKVYAIYQEAQQACLEAGGPAPADETQVTEGDDTTSSDTTIDPCTVTVEQLLAELETMGMGQLFKVYGKPAIMGVGHVRNIGEADSTSGSNGSSGGQSGICNARSHGGNAKANGQPDVSCDDTSGGTTGTEGDPEQIQGDQ